jgi:hypothetical protein
MTSRHAGFGILSVLHFPFYHLEPLSSAAVVSSDASIPGRLPDQQDDLVSGGQRDQLMIIKPGPLGR